MATTQPNPVEAKTVFQILSSLKDTKPAESEVFVSEAKLQLEVDDDILILKKNPETNERTINKSAYLKLHRSVSPNRDSIDKIKEKYESTRTESIESIKNKYSPAALGYANKPQPEPRRSKLFRSQILAPKSDTKAARLSLNIDKHKFKDVNSNNVEDLSSGDEFVTIVTRSDSEESVLRFQKELSAFTMDKKKRTNSFRKIFSVFSNKDKKKSKEDKHKNKENGETHNENYHNESNSFHRNVPYRHTTGGDVKNKPITRLQRSDSDVKVPKQYEDQLVKDYAQMHINQFNQYKQNFEGYNSNTPANGYTPMDKPIYKSSKYIDSSSSASTLESDRSNIYQNEVLRANQPKEEEVELRNHSSNSFRPNRLSDGRRDTPPRLTETKQDVRLVNPKALIPINSERALPNPYQNGQSPNVPLCQSTPNDTQLDETYGTVFDSLDSRKQFRNGKEERPRPPSVEPTKLRLPPNRDIVPLSPRIRSPIPHENISPEKIIATELLKPKKSSKAINEPSHQRLEIDIDYPDVHYSRDNVQTKPPVAAKPPKKPESRMSVASRSSSESVFLKHRPDGNLDRVTTTNAQVHTNSPINRTPTPNNSNSTQSLSSPMSLRPSTPLNSQIPESPKTSPQKEDMRKSVEAYYWKEIKRLKDQENYELYLYQMQYGSVPYAEDIMNVRRSRSMSPTANRNGRRSLSLPREAKQQQQQDKYYPNAIPENRAVMAQPRSAQQLQFQQQQYFQRNTPGRSTIDGTNPNSLYRPIFKRGSLSTPPRQLADDSLKRKVSFSGAQDQNVQSWPTKNGYTQSPPQRRIDKLQSQGDDEVFFPNTPNNRFSYTNRPSEDMYYNTRQEPTYVLRANPNSLYLHQRPVESNYGPRSTSNQEDLYGQPIDAVRPQVRPLVRHGSIQIQEELYGQRPVPRRVSYTNMVRPGVSSTPIPQEYVRRPPLRREIIMNDEIFGQFGGYTPQRVAPQNVYSSRQSITDYNSRVREEYYNRPKQVSVSNKVCDIYGQIHDGEQKGVVMGQLQRVPGSPAVVRNSYSHLAGRDNFIRNSRLTASANDMYRRVQQQYQNSNEVLYGRIEQQNGNGPPSRPLPPVPQKARLVSDTESGSDASEIRRIVNNNVKPKRKGLFGK